MYSGGTHLIKARGNGVTSKVWAWSTRGVERRACVQERRNAREKEGWGEEVERYTTSDLAKFNRENRR